MEGRHRNERQVADVELGRKLAELVLDLLEPLLVVVDEVHLVDCEYEVRDTQERSQEGVALRLLEHPLTGIEQHDRKIGGRRTGHHVAGVLGMAGSVGDDELALRRRKIAVGDVDGDALFPLGP